jgi:hypothetical protein
MPSADIWPQLIKRATQIKDPISEINHKEMKTDHRNLKKDEIEHVTIEEIHG